MFRYLQLESTWILSNISFGDVNDIKIMLSPKYRIFEYMNRILESTDLQMIDQVLWIISNSCSESLRLRNLILTKTKIICAIE